MTRSAWAVVCAAALCTCVSAQTPVTPVRQAPTTAAPVEETPEQREIRRMMQEYLTGDADAAVAFFAGRPRPDETPGTAAWVYALGSDRDVARGLAHALLTTEIAMRRRTFGKYAMSAPLETSKTGIIGLNGAFEMSSFMLYRNLDDLLHIVRYEALPRALPLDPSAAQQRPSPTPPGARALVEEFFREWHVVTISHCARWQLDCADTLLASAQQYFGDTADVLVLSAALAEARGDSSVAQTLLHRALSVDPNHTSAHLRLGRLLARTARSTDAGRELGVALERARAEQNAGAAYFALMSLADLDARAGRTTSARARRAEAASLKAFGHPCFAGLPPDAIYRAGLFYEQPWRVAALRTLAR